MKMVLAALLLAGCQGVETVSTPAEMACESTCDVEGKCMVSLVLIGTADTRERKITLDMPTQTKVGLDD